MKATALHVHLVKGGTIPRIRKDSGITGTMPSTPHINPSYRQNRRQLQRRINAALRYSTNPHPSADLVTSELLRHAPNDRLRKRYHAASATGYRRLRAERGILNGFAMAATSQNATLSFTTAFGLGHTYALSIFFG